MSLLMPVYLEITSRVVFGCFFAAATDSVQPARNSLRSGPFAEIVLFDDQNAPTGTLNGKSLNGFLSERKPPAALFCERNGSWSTIASTRPARSAGPSSAGDIASAWTVEGSPPDFSTA